MEPFESWAILELMGHVRVAGKITEEERFGAKLGRIDIPNEAGSFTTQYFGGGSVYRLTPCTEEAARHVAKTNQPLPVSPWELPRAIAAPRREPEWEDDPEFGERDDDE